MGDALRLEYKRYKENKRNEIVFEEDRLGFALEGVRQQTGGRHGGEWVANEVVESDKYSFDRKLYSANGQHILFSDANGHVDTEEKEMMQKEQTRRQRMKSKLSSM